MIATRLGRPWHVVERNVTAYRRAWLMFVSGFAEPLLFLLAVGMGVGALTGDITTSSGDAVPYQVFVAPAMLAVSSMNGVVFDSTFNFFFKYKYAGIYETILATPVSVRELLRGELFWNLIRSAVYSSVFLLVMLALGLIESPWAVFALPAALLIGFGFAGVGYAATTFMRSFVDFDYVNAVILPLFLFSGTFFPVSQYPGALEWVVRCSPLYQGVALQRALILGDLSWTLVLNIAYLAVMGSVGLRIATRRMGKLLQP